MLSRLGWLTNSGWFTNINGDPSAAGRAQDRESSPVKDQHFTTVSRNLCHLFTGDTDLLHVASSCIPVVVSQTEWLTSDGFLLVLQQMLNTARHYRCLYLVSVSGCD